VVGAVNADGREMALKVSRIIVTALLLLFPFGALAYEGCVMDALGNPVCAPPNGVITKDALGQIVCGHGRCIRDALGQVICSRQPGGFVMKNELGQVICTGGCSKGNRNICVIPRP